MEELLQAIKKKKPQTTHRLWKKKKQHSFQSIPWLYAGLFAARKGALSKINSNTIWTSAKMVIWSIFYLMFGLPDTPNQIHNFGPFPVSSLPLLASDRRQCIKHISYGMIPRGKLTVHPEGKISDMKRLQTSAYQRSLLYFSFLLHGHAH